MPSPKRLKKLKASFPKVSGKAQIAPPPHNPKLDKQVVLRPYSEEGSTLTKAEMERSKLIKAEEKVFKGLVRFVQGGAAGTKG